MASKNRRVVKYKKSRNINIGIIIFGVTFIYLLISLILYFSRDKITVYEVVKGQSSTAVTGFTGLIVRDEIVTDASKSGYINFYARDTSHVSVGTNLYTIDDSGKISSILEAAKDTQLNADTLNLIRDSISSFTLNFSNINFSSVYDLKYNLTSSVIENFYLHNIDNLNASHLEIVKADTAGTVLFYTDNYEGINADNVTNGDFDTGGYKKSLIKSEDLIESGKPIFKTVTSDSWYLLIPLTESQAQRYQEKTALPVTFSKDGLSVSASFSIIEKGEGRFGKLDFNKYTIRYVNDRFLDIKIKEDTVSGLKIPKSAVTEKDFYKIPAAYISKGGDSNKDGFYKETYTQNGQASVVFETPVIYYKTEEYCYVDKSSFESGDVIAGSDSSSKYQIGETESLKGVYNINNGFTDFKLIDIKAETNEYYIVSENTSNGLIIYDRIALDAGTVKENKVIYQ